MTKPIRNASTILALVATLAVARSACAQELPDAQKNVAQLISFVSFSGVLLSLFVILGASIALRFLRSAVDRLAARFAHLRLTFQKIESISRFVVYLATGAIALALSVQLNQTVLTLVGGTLAVAIGFAMRDLVASMLAGVIIMLDRPFQVGDRVQFAGEYGDITAIGLRSVRLQTLDDNTVTIPNSKVLTDVTSSGNWGSLEMQVQIDLFVGVECDVELAERLVEEAVLTSRYVFFDKPVAVAIAEVLRDGYVALHLCARAYVVDTRYELAFKGDVTKRALRAFAVHGIRSPLVPIGKAITETVPLRGAEIATPARPLDAQA